MEALIGTARRKPAAPAQRPGLFRVPPLAHSPPPPGQPRGGAGNTAGGLGRPRADQLFGSRVGRGSSPTGLSGGAAGYFTRPSVPLPSDTRRRSGLSSSDSSDSDDGDGGGLHALNPFRSPPQSPQLRPRERSQRRGGGGGGGRGGGGRGGGGRGGGGGGGARVPPGWTVEHLRAVQGMGFAIPQALRCMRRLNQQVARGDRPPPSAQSRVEVLISEILAAGNGTGDSDSDSDSSGSSDSHDGDGDGDGAGDGVGGGGGEGGRAGGGGGGGMYQSPFLYPPPPAAGAVGMYGARHGPGGMAYPVMQAPMWMPPRGMPPPPPHSHRGARTRGAALSDYFTPGPAPPALYFNPDAHGAAVPAPGMSAVEWSMGDTSAGQHRPAVAPPWLPARNSWTSGMEPPPFELPPHSQPRQRHRGVRHSRAAQTAVAAVAAGRDSAGAGGGSSADATLVPAPAPVAAAVDVHGDEELLASTEELVGELTQEAVGGMDADALRELVLRQHKALGRLHKRLHAMVEGRLCRVRRHHVVPCGVVRSGVGSFDVMCVRTDL